MRDTLTAAAVRRALRTHADPTRATASARFFKTAPGEYGAGDRFIGVTVPAQRTVARRFRHLPLADIDNLLTSPIHEERLTALILLVSQFNEARRLTHPQAVRGRIFRLYLRRRRFINNWDLVDTSAGPILGGWIAESPTDVRLLDRLARSRRLWDRRMAMLATLHSIARGDHRIAIRIATVLVHDREDLMHKAVGWMLREVGKRASAEALDAFLNQHASTMPRTMLRYAIERLPPSRRSDYMRRQAAAVSP